MRGIFDLNRRKRSNVSLCQTLSSWVLCLRTETQLLHDYQADPGLVRLLFSLVERLSKECEDLYVRASSSVSQADAERVRNLIAEKMSECQLIAKNIDFELKGG